MAELREPVQDEAAAGEDVGHDVVAPRVEQGAEPLEPGRPADDRLHDRLDEPGARRCDGGELQLLLAPAEERVDVAPADPEILGEAAEGQPLEPFLTGEVSGQMQDPRARRVSLGPTQIPRRLRHPKLP